MFSNYGCHVTQIHQKSVKFCWKSDGIFRHSDIGCFEIGCFKKDVRTSQDNTNQQGVFSQPIYVCSVVVFFV